MTSKCFNWLTGVDFIASQVIVTNKVETGLVNITSEGEALSVQKLGEVVTAIVGVVNLTDLDGIISQEVVNNIWKVFAVSIEAQNLAILVKELLLAGYLTTTQGLFHVLLHLVVTWAGLWNLGLSEKVEGNFLAL